MRASVASRSAPCSRSWRASSELTLELLATRVGVLDVLLADLVGHVLHALGHPLGGLAGGASLGDDVVLRIRPRDEEERHRQPEPRRPAAAARAADGRRGAGRPRAQPGAGVGELADLERIVGLVAGQLEGRSQPLAQGQLLVGAPGGLDERRTRARRIRRPRHDARAPTASLDEGAIFEREGARQELDERHARARSRR